MAQLLAQVSFADQHHADAGDLFENARQIADGAGVLTLDDDEDFAVGYERPDIGAGVIFLLRKPPVACRAVRRVAANPRRIVERRSGQTRISAGTNRVPRFFDAAVTGG